MERPNEVDWYVDESHIYGTAALERDAPPETQASLVFTAEEIVRQALLRINAEEEDFPNKKEGPPSAPDLQVPAPEIPPQVETEQEDGEAEDEEAADVGEEDTGDPAAARQATDEASENTNSSQVRGVETQLGLLKKQGELDLLLQQQAFAYMSKEDFEAHMQNGKYANC